MLIVTVLDVSAEVHAEDLVVEHLGLPHQFTELPVQTIESL